MHGGCDGNTAMADHIWDNLCTEESNNTIENVVDQAPDQQIDQIETSPIDSFRLVER